jgi:hypothetical protein
MLPPPHLIMDNSNDSNAAAPRAHSYR